MHTFALWHNELPTKGSVVQTLGYEAAAALLPVDSLQIPARSFARAEPIRNA